MDSQIKYVPGVCNINAAEVEKRRRIGFVNLGALLILVGLLFAFKMPAAIWFVTFIPAFVMTTGFLQAKNKFCVGYAGAGMHHTGEKAEKTTDAKATAIDKQRARKINTHVAVIALIIAAVAVIIGTLVV